MSRKWATRLSECNSVTGGALLGGAPPSSFVAASSASGSAVASLPITKPAGVVADDIMVASIAAKGAGGATLPTFRSVSPDATNAQDSTSESIIITKPTGTVLNDFLFAQIETGSVVNPTIVPPAGWTPIRDDMSGTVHVFLFWKRATAAEPATYTFTINSSLTGGVVLARIAAYINIVTTGNPISGSSGQSQISAGSPANPAVAPSISGVSSASLLLATFSGNGILGWNPPAGMTERADGNGDLPVESANSTCLDDEVFSAGGTTGIRSATTDIGLNSTFVVSQMVAVTPVPTAFATPTFVAVGVQLSLGILAGSNNLPVSRPAGVILDDVMIAQIGISSPTSVTPDVVNPPVGWTLIREDDSPVGAQPLQQLLFWKRATASEPVIHSFNIIHQTGSGNGNAFGRISAYRNVINVGSPVNGSSGVADLSGVVEDDVVIPSIPATFPNTLLVACYFGGTTGTGTWSTPAGMTERADSNGSLDDEVFVAGGDTGTRTSAGSGVGTGENLLGSMVALTAGQIASPAIIPPTGWTLIQDESLGTLKMSLWWLRAGAAEPASYTWTFDTSAEAIGSISAYQDLLPVGDPVLESNLVAQAGGISPVSIGPASAVNNGVVYASMVLGAGARTFTPITSFAERIDTSSAALSHSVDDIVPTVAGAVSGTWPFTGAAVDEISGFVVLSPPTASGGGEFIGDCCDPDLDDFQGIRIFAYSDVASATDGLVVDWSEDGGVTWRPFDKYTVLAGLLRSITLPIRAGCFRVRYLNGPDPQTEFQLETTLLPEADMPTLATGVPTTVRVLESWIEFDDGVPPPGSPIAVATKAGEPNRNHYITAVSVGIDTLLGLTASDVLISDWILFFEPFGVNDILFRGSFGIGDHIVFTNPIKVATGLGIQLQVIPNLLYDLLLVSGQALLLGYTLPDTQQLGN